MPTADITGTYSVPAGLAFVSLSSHLTTGGVASFPVGRTTAVGGNFSVRVPAPPDAGYTLELRTSNGDAASYAYRTVQPDAARVALDPQPENALIAPADGATGVNESTVFSWTPSVFGVHLVHVYGSDAFDMHVAIVTAATKTSIPDLQAYGLPFGAGRTHSWRVLAFGPYDTVDEQGKQFRRPIGPSGRSSRISQQIAPKMPWAA